MGVLRQYDPASFEIDGNILKIKQTFLDGAANGRQVWTPPLLSNSSALPVVIAYIPWVATDSPLATNKAMHLRALLQTTDAGIAATLTLTSTNTGQNLTIYGSGNVFSTNSTSVVQVESNVDVFSTPSNVFDPTVNDILYVTMSASGDATVKCKHVELVLVAK